MLGFMFGLNARLGRLQYFLSTIGLAVVMTGICFVMARESFDATANGIPPSIEMIKGPAIVLGIIFLLITLTLQAMRFRDIGWDPVCVIPGWFAVLIVDMLVAKKFPGLSLGPEHHGTAVGPLNVETNPILMLSPAIAGLASARTVAPASQKLVFIVCSLLTNDLTHRASGWLGLPRWKSVPLAQVRACVFCWPRWYER
jgi:uncharacterized membrane protein YhaH (DUF805 family)